MLINKISGTWKRVFQQWNSGSAWSRHSALIMLIPIFTVGIRLRATLQVPEFTLCLDHADPDFYCWNTSESHSSSPRVYTVPWSCWSRILLLEYIWEPLFKSQSLHCALIMLIPIFTVGIRLRATLQVPEFTLWLDHADPDFYCWNTSESHSSSPRVYTVPWSCWSRFLLLEYVWEPLFKSQSLHCALIMLIPIFIVGIHLRATLQVPEFTLCLDHADPDFYCWDTSESHSSSPRVYTVPWSCWSRFLLLEYVWEPLFKSQSLHCALIMLIPIFIVGIRLRATLQVPEFTLCLDHADPDFYCWDTSESHSSSPRVYTVAWSCWSRFLLLEYVWEPLFKSQSLHCVLIMLIPIFTVGIRLRATLQVPEFTLCLDHADPDFYCWNTLRATLQVPEFTLWLDHADPEFCCWNTSESHSSRPRVWRSRKQIGSIYVWSVYSLYARDPFVDIGPLFYDKMQRKIQGHLRDKGL